MRDISPTKFAPLPFKYEKMKIEKYGKADGYMGRNLRTAGNNAPGRRTPPSASEGRAGGLRGGSCPAQAPYGADSLRRMLISSSIQK